MIYNSSLKSLPLPEYGRSIHEMVEHIITIEDKDTRNLAAKTLIKIMGNKNPHLRDVEDFTHKLWDHLYIMAGYDIDFESPYPKPVPKETDLPVRVSYGIVSKIKYKYYGSTVSQFIKEAIKMEEGEKKEAFVENIANLMKKFYLNYNRDSVEDEVINKHLIDISEGQLKIKPEYNMVSTAEILLKSRHKKRSNNSKPSRKKKNYQKHK